MWVRMIAPAVAAALGYGFWALYVNGGTVHGLLPGVAYGTYAAAITLLANVIQEMVHWARRYLAWPAFIVALLVQFAITAFAGLVLMVTQADHILLTLLPGFVIGMIYNYAYCVYLRGRK